MENVMIIAQTATIYLNSSGAYMRKKQPSPAARGLGRLCFFQWRVVC